jgi:hypothetical protein
VVAIHMSNGTAGRMPGHSDPRMDRAPLDGRTFLPVFTVAASLGTKVERKAIQRLVRRLNDLGCEVHVTPQAA